MTAHENLVEKSREARAHLSYQTPQDWRSLRVRYAELQAAFDRLGGELGTEAEADALWEEQQLIVEALATFRAQSLEEISEKLQIAMDCLADDGNDAGCNMLRSVHADMRAIRSNTN